MVNGVYFVFSLFAEFSFSPQTSSGDFICISIFFFKYPSHFYWSITTYHISVVIKSFSKSTITLTTMTSTGGPLNLMNVLRFLFKGSGFSSVSSVFLLFCQFPYSLWSDGHSCRHHSLWFLALLSIKLVCVFDSNSYDDLWFIRLFSTGVTGLCYKRNPL